MAKLAPLLAAMKNAISTTSPNISPSLFGSNSPTASADAPIHTPRQTSNTFLPHTDLVYR